MGRVLICEPHPEVRGLLRHVVERLGHEALERPEAGLDLDLILVEPADPSSLAAAERARAGSARVPIVCASIKPANGQTAALQPAAYLLKPFSLPDLQAAIRVALGP